MGIWEPCFSLRSKEKHSMFLRIFKRVSDSEIAVINHVTSIFTFLFLPPLLSFWLIGRFNPTFYTFTHEHCGLLHLRVFELSLINKFTTTKTKVRLILRIYNINKKVGDKSMPKVSTNINLDPKFKKICTETFL